MPDLTLEQRAAAFYQGTSALSSFATQKVIPLLQAKTTRPDIDLAVITTYYRMHLWSLDVSKLNYPVHFQTVLNAVRGLFELLVDLKLLIADPTRAEKFHDFSFVTRFAAAEKYVNCLDADPGYTQPAKPELRRVFVSDAANRKKYDDLRRKHWGTDKKGKVITPEHWSGLGGMADRCANLSPSETRRYRDIYSQCSWFVHSGSAGVAGVSPDGILAAFGWGHGQIQNLFGEGTEIVCEHQQLFAADSGLRDLLAIAKVATGLFVP
jgi:hypothetical protein